MTLLCAVAAEIQSLSGAAELANASIHSSYWFSTWLLLRLPHLWFELIGFLQFGICLVDVWLV